MLLMWAIAVIGRLCVGVARRRHRFISFHKTQQVQKPHSALGFGLILFASMRESLNTKGALTRQLERWL
jgi:hypothetical protein